MPASIQPSRVAPSSDLISSCTLIVHTEYRLCTLIVHTEYRLCTSTVHIRPGVLRS